MGDILNVNLNDEQKQRVTLGGLGCGLMSLGCMMPLIALVALVIIGLICVALGVR